MKRTAYLVARQIIRDDTAWYWHTCKVSPERLNVHSLATAVLPWLAKGVLIQDLVASWARAVRKAHAATVDGLTDRPEAYAIACWRELLT
jgi:hypothetical protein